MNSSLLKSMLSFLIIALIASTTHAKNLRLGDTISSETQNKNEEVDNFKDYVHSLKDPDENKAGSDANFEDADGSDTTDTDSEDADGSDTIDTDSEEEGSDDWWNKNWNHEGHDHDCTGAYGEVHVNHYDDQETCAEKCCGVNARCTHFKHYFIGWYGRC